MNEELAKNHSEVPPSSTRWRSRLDVAAAVAMIAAAGVIVYSSARAGGSATGAVHTTSAAPPLPAAPVPTDSAATQGSLEASVAIVEYADFQCPRCGDFVRQTLPAIQQKYVDRGSVLLVYRHLPLSIHPFAEKASEAAICAGRQGKEWEMNDLLFSNQKQLDVASLDDRARALHLDSKAFDACLAGDAAVEVKRDADEARVLHISGTPTFLIGTLGLDRRVTGVAWIVGARPLADFTAVLDRAIASASTRK